MTLLWLGRTSGLDLKIPSQIEKGISSSLIDRPSWNVGGGRDGRGRDACFPVALGKKPD